MDEDRLSQQPARSIRVTNPATGQLLGEVPDLGPEAIETAFARARRAAPGWAAESLAMRLEAIRRWRTALLDDDQLCPTLVRESGKPRHEAEGFELLYFCELVRWLLGHAHRALGDETRSSALLATKITRVSWRPLGVVGVIGPWNFPLLNNGADALAPLVAGNAVVLKPSELTPLTSLRLAELWRQAGNPADVFQVVTGSAATGAAVVARADGVMFTGSVAAGRKVAAACGERLVPCVAELGGKSPFIVLAGANLEAAAAAAAWSSFAHSGQICIRGERILVVESVADGFERRLIERVEALRQEVPDPTGGHEHDLGALTAPALIARAEQQIANAVAGGARVACGGQRRDRIGDAFFAPTVILGVTPAMALAGEETFAPLIGVERVADAAAALAGANDSHLGLAATVFGEAREALALAQRLEAGMVMVNGALMGYFAVGAPLAGWKASGIGHRHGETSLRQWTRPSAITAPRLGLGWLDRLVAGQLAFPYRARTLGILRRALHLYRG